MKKYLKGFFIFFIVILICLGLFFIFPKPKTVETKTTEQQIIDNTFENMKFMDILITVTKDNDFYFASYKSNNEKAYVSVMENEKYIDYVNKKIYEDNINDYQSENILEIFNAISYKDFSSLSKSDNTDGFFTITTTCDSTILNKIFSLQELKDLNLNFNENFETTFLFDNISCKLFEIRFVNENTIITISIADGGITEDIKFPF